MKGRINEIERSYVMQKITQSKSLRLIFFLIPEFLANRYLFEIIFEIWSVYDGRNRVITARNNSVISLYALGIALTAPGPDTDITVVCDNVNIHPTERISVSSPRDFRIPRVHCQRLQPSVTISCTLLWYNTVVSETFKTPFQFCLDCLWLLVQQQCLKRHIFSDLYDIMNTKFIDSRSKGDLLTDNYWLKLIGTSRRDMTINKCN